MKKRFPVLCFYLALLVASSGQAAEKVSSSAKAKVLIHLTQGPENPTRAALAFLVAKTALAEGHAVSLFLAADAVQLMRDPVLDQLVGLGTGKLREHYDAIVNAGGKFYLSGGSSKARGLIDTEIKGKPVEFATPEVLLGLSLSHDRMFTY
jgi:uncharacterized protein